MHLNLQEKSSTTMKMQKNNEKSFVLPKNYYDAKHNPLQFQIGDVILFLTKNIAIQGPRKLATHFIGPFHVIHRVGPQAYKLNLPSSLQVYPVFHVSLIKLLSPSLVA